MNDKMCSLGMAEITAIIAYESIGNTKIAKKLEEYVKGEADSYGITNLLEYTLNRDAASFIEKNILYNKYNNNILLIQEQIFVERKKEVNLDSLDKGAGKIDKSQINYQEKNRIAIFQAAISELFMKYAHPKDTRLSLLPVLVYLGKQDEQFDIEYTPCLTNTTYSYDPYYQFGIIPNKDFLFLNIRSIDWDKILDLKFDEDNIQNVYDVKRLLIAGYYKILICLYDDDTDKIFYALHKIQHAINYLLKDYYLELYSYLLGIRENLTDKLSFFKTSNKFEIERSFNKFLTIK